MSCDGRETSLSTQFLLMIVFTLYWKKAYTPRDFAFLVCGNANNGYRKSRRIFPKCNYISVELELIQVSTLPCRRM
jgi:hypothetical protein